MMPFDHVQRMAEAYVTLPDLGLTAEQMAAFEREVDTLYAQIPIPVRWVVDGQPFDTAGHMKRHAETKNELLMFGGPSILGDVYKRHRAVHDWFGHVIHGLPFGIDGEMATYRIHRDQYSPLARQIVFSDVVLANAYYECTGSREIERYVRCDDTAFMPAECPFDKARRAAA